MGSADTDNGYTAARSLYGSQNVFGDSEGEEKKMNRMVCFTLIVIPDLFTTSKCLQEELQAVLVKYPHAKIVIIGLPGGTKTLYPEKLLLTPALHSTAILKILCHLYEEKRIFSGNDDDNGCSDRNKTDSFGNTINTNNHRNNSHNNTGNLTTNHGSVVDREEVVYFLGFGVGVFSLLRFVTLSLPDLPWLTGRARCVLAVNGVTRLTRQE